jgi:hypothetical protein
MSVSHDCTLAFSAIKHWGSLVGGYKIIGQFNRTKSMKTHVLFEWILTENRCRQYVWSDRIHLQQSATKKASSFATGWGRGVQWGCLIR